MPRVTRNGVSIYYERDERGGRTGYGEDDVESDPSSRTRRGRDSAPVVFLQDVGCGRWLWRWQREAVADSFDVVAPDTRGTGRSDDGLLSPLGRLPRPLRTRLPTALFGFSVAGLAADLEAVLEDTGASSVHLVGTGFGGMIAQQYALEYSRAASLTLCGTTHGGPDALSAPEETRAELRSISSSGDDREAIRRRARLTFSDRFLNRNPHLFDRIVEWQREQGAGTLAREAQQRAVDSFDVSRQLDRIRVPTLILHGTADRLVPVENARLLETKISNSRLETIEGGSHRLVLEQSDTVADRLLEFLSKQRDVPRSGLV